MSYRIPLFDLNFDAQEEQAVLDVLRDRWISMGPRTELFERRFEQLLGTPQAVAVSNCTAAPSSGAARVGHRARRRSDRAVADLRCDGCCDPLRRCRPRVLRHLWSGRTDNRSRASAGSHHLEDARPLSSCTMRDFPATWMSCWTSRIVIGLYLVEDAAHAPGSLYNGRPLGTIGDIGCFSFFSNKNITTGGRGHGRHGE